MNYKIKTDDFSKNTDSYMSDRVTIIFCSWNSYSKVLYAVLQY